MSKSFKNVGKTTQEVIDTAIGQASTRVDPIGIATPVQTVDDGTGIFKMNFILEDQVADNLRNLIQTNWGERLGQYTLGANLHEITTEIVSQDDFDNEAMSRIKNAVSSWMPYVELVDFSSNIEHVKNPSTGKITITVTYSIPALSDKLRSIAVSLYII